jgi:hypothetical protein
MEHSAWIVSMDVKDNKKEWVPKRRRLGTTIFVVCQMQSIDPSSDFWE